MVPEHFRLKNTIKYPTSLIVGGLSRLGLEIVDSLIEQGGYVIIADSLNEENISKLSIFPKDALVSFIDYSALVNLDEDLRRLDYIFYFNHESLDYMSKVSTQEFLKFSSYLDTCLSLATKFEAKFLLTSAIRAHQLGLTYDDLSLKYSENSSERHTVYTEMEVQKYAESLVMEYVEKTHLDGRIARLGEVIGEGIDFNTKSFFNSLILDVANRQPLKLSKDGLESEWMVHLMDAAYGIIKAQFSKDTAGKIFSITYPNPFTHLSLAYKVQEIDPDAQEIQFIDDANNLPEIRLYKPAPNLSVIGWAPKVPIEKALMQSIAAAKIYILENSGSAKSKHSKNKVTGKLKNFLTLAESKEDVKEEYGGPISRLIAERRSLETQSSKNDLPDSKHKASKKEIPVKEKVSRKLWNFSFSFAGIKNFFKTKTKFQLIRLVIFVVLVVVFFIYIFSPIVSIGKDILAILPFYNATLTSLENNSYKPQNLHADILDSSLKNMNSNLENFAGLANLFGMSSQYIQLKSTLSAYSELAEGLNNIQFAVDPLYQYLNSFENNTKVTTQDSSSTGYLLVSDQAKDYSSLLTDFKNKAPYLESGIEKYSKGLNDAEAINYSGFPSFLSERLVNFNFRLSQDEALINSLKSTENIPEILGLGTPKTYLILITDNTRLKPIGGEISAYALVTISNGAVNYSLVESANQVQFNYKGVSDSTINEINLRKFLPISRENISYQDFADLSNFSDYSIAISNLFKDSLGKQIDGVLSLNFDSLASILTTLDSNNLKTNIDGIDYPGSDFLNSLDLSKATNNSLAEKNTVLARISAQSLSSILTNLNLLFPKLVSTLNAGIDNKNILLNTPALDYQSYVQDSNLQDNDSNLKNFGYTIGYDVLDPKIVTVNTALSLQVTEEARIDSKSVLSYKLNLKFPSVGSAQLVSICVPVAVANADIKVVGVDSSNVVINSGLDQKCLVSKTAKETSLEADWKYPVNLQLDADQNYILNLPTKKIRGSDYTLNKTVILEPDLKLQSISPTTQLQSNSYIYNPVENHDLDVKVLYTKVPSTL